jgi:hypothetical protein
MTAGLAAARTARLAATAALSELPIDRDSRVLIVQLIDARRCDTGVSKVDILQRAQSLQMFKTGVGDLSVIES